MFETLRKNLEKRGFPVSVFATAAEAADYLNAEIDGKTVGFGGSETVITDMGMYESLGRHNTVCYHNRCEPEQKKDVMRKAAEADVYLCSVNAVAETGEIINIDGTCNRVSSVFYGHAKVYLVVGKNKIAPDYESALWRARNIASPLNARRLGRKTPCAGKADRCYDCDSPERICCGLTVLWRQPLSGHIEVVLVDEELGY